MNTNTIKNKLRDTKEVHIGDEFFPVIVTHVGVSNNSDSIKIERDKIKRAVSLGTTMIEELSLVGNIPEIQKRLLDELTVPLAAVSIYEVYAYAQKNNMHIHPDRFINIIEEEMKRGIDMLTIHATVFREDVYILTKSSRIIPSTSRGGTMLLELLKINNYENPFFTYFEDILKLAKKYSVYISLGPCYRPGSVYDCYLEEELHAMELDRMSNLVQMAQKYDVGIAIEGIGHAPINVIPKLIETSKKKCFNVPYRAMTVATDIAIGYDHVSSAIASAVAVLNGANSIACVSRAEHIGLPTIEDIEEAVITAKIAAYCGYSARINDFSKDKIVSIARHKYGCIGKPELMLIPEVAYSAIRKYNYKKQNKECTMCGEFCALNTSDRIVKEYMTINQSEE